MQHGCMQMFIIVSLRHIHWFHTLHIYDFSSFFLVLVVVVILVVVAVATAVFVVIAVLMQHRKRKEGQGSFRSLLFFLLIFAWFIFFQLFLYFHIMTFCSFTIADVIVVIVVDVKRNTLKSRLDCISAQLYLAFAFFAKKKPVVKHNILQRSPTIFVGICRCRGMRFHCLQQHPFFHLVA